MRQRRAVHRELLDASAPRADARRDGCVYDVVRVDMSRKRLRAVRVRCADSARCRLGCGKGCGEHADPRRARFRFVLLARMTTRQL